MSPILIWGAGAIGGTLAAAFLRAGHEVLIVDAAADHVAAINRDGLKIEGPIWQDTCRIPAVLPADLTGSFDTAFLCVKAHHTEAAIAALGPHVAASGCVVSAQNGLNERVIARAIGAGRHHRLLRQLRRRLPLARRGALFRPRRGGDRRTRRRHHPPRRPPSMPCWPSSSPTPSSRPTSGAISGAS